MAFWTVDVGDRLLSLKLVGSFTVAEMNAFVAAHNAGVDSFNGTEYRVFCNIRELRALPPACGLLMESAKAYSASQPGFQGSAVYVANKIVAVQHQKTSVTGGVMNTELISDDEMELRLHLDTVRRTPATPTSE